YLYELLRQKRLLPRRQEAEEWGLVSHEEVSEWAAGTRDAMLISVSHAWETRQHPDPCGDQLNRLVSGLRIYDDAYVSEIWVFYDYVSLFQYERQTVAEYESFRRAMRHMHMCYAHECNWTVRLEALTPDDVWDAALQNSEHLVRVYDDESKTVRGLPLKELMLNRVPYRDRGWCKAEVEWSSCRSRSEQNQCLDAPGSEVNSESELKGKVPMAPEVFQEDIRRAEFTHRNDAGIVQRLQHEIYYEKVSASTLHSTRTKGH
ncbi:NLRC3, partial [Symbiodinium necroappetens]